MSLAVDPPNHRWFSRVLDDAQHKVRVTLRLVMIAGLVGLVAGLGAIVFEVVSQVVVAFALERIVGYHPIHPAGETELLGASRTPFSPWLLLIVPTIGGFLSGALVYWFAPEAAGHGTDAAIDAYHRKDGFIRPQVPIVKLFSSAITIGTGGSGGREGPIAQIGAGFGCFLARMLKLTLKERRILMAAGMGAGVGAIFRAPLAGALFAAEVLYRDPEFESDVIVPAGVAGAIAYAVFAIPFGFRPLFDPPVCKFGNPMELVPYTILAIVVSMVAILYVKVFYFTHDRFERSKLHRLVKPAIGAFFTGVVGLAFWSFYRAIEPDVAKDSLSVMSYGYGILQNFLIDETIEPTGIYFLAFLFFSVAIGKIITTSLTIGSGGSGGVFGPSMVIGGCVGGSLGLLFHQWMPALVPVPAAFMVVGMAGFFTAAAKTPFSTLIMVSELTGNYHLLPPTMWVCLIAYLASPDNVSLYRSQVSGPMKSPAHAGEFARKILSHVTIDRFLQRGRPPITVHRGDSLESVLSDIDTTVHAGNLPVVDDNKAFLGMLCLEEVHLASHSRDLAPWVVVADMMRDNVIPLYPGDSLYRAMELFARNDLNSLPIVATEEGVERVVGLVRRADVQIEYLRHLHGERKA